MRDEHEQKLLPQKLDALLDQALASYVDQEPDASLRARISARAAERSTRRGWAWPLAALTAFAAAALFIALLLHPAAQLRTPHAAQNEAIARTSELPARVPQPNEVRAGSSPRMFRAERVDRRVFRAKTREVAVPTPLVPPTEQETLLMHFVAEHPDEARQVLTAPGSQPLENAPLAIATIHIAPLSETAQAQEQH